MSNSNPCTKASDLIQRGNVKGALEQVKRCKKQLRTQLVKSPPQSDLINQQLARVFRLEAQIYTSLEKFSRAIESLEQGKNILDKLSKNSENRILLANIQYSLGLVQMITGDYTSSIQNYAESMQLFGDLKQYTEAGEIGFRLIELYSQQNDPETVLKLINSTEKLVKKDKNKDTKNSNLVRLKIYEAKSKLKLDDQETAMKILEKAKKKASDQKDDNNLLLILSEIADIHFRTSNFAFAEEVYLELYDMAVSSDLKKFEALALMQLGIISLKSARLEQGKKRLLKGLKIRTELGDKRGTAQVLVELARIGFLTSQSDDDLSQALKFANQASDLYSESNYDYGLAQTQELLANIQVRMQDFDNAYKNINQALKIFKKFKDVDGEGRMLTQLAIVLDQINRGNEIEPVLNKAEKNFISIGNNQGLAEVLHIKAQLETDPSKALEYLQKCRALYEEIIGQRKELQPILTVIDNKIAEITNQ